MAVSHKQLTNRQVDFLRKLFAYKQKEGIPPTFQEMAAFGDFKSPRSVSQYLEALEEAGYIRRLPGARNIRFLQHLPPERAPENEDTVVVPIIGAVAAGLPILAEENIEDTRHVSARLAKPPHRYFLLHVKGNSMNRVGIQNRDLVLVRKQEAFNEGDCVVALINGEATVKKIRKAGAVYVLEPQSTDKSNKPIFVDDDFRIQGIVVSVIPSE
jgi:repressor LexA